MINILECLKAGNTSMAAHSSMTLAVDRDFIVREIGKAGQEPAGAFVSIGLSDADLKKEFREVGGNYYDPTAAANEKNLAEAKKLLAEAGYPDGKGLPTIEYIYSDPISFLDMWITGGGNNDAKWSNAEYDALIAKVKSSSDRKERMKLMHQAEDIIFEEPMLCPIYCYAEIFLKNQKLEGFYSSPLGYKYYMYTRIKG